MTTLPRDTDNVPIPALRLKPSGAHKIDATTTSAKNTTAFEDDTQIVSVYATGAVYVNFGQSDVSATPTDHYFPNGLYYDIAVGGDKTLHTPYLAVISAGSDCTVYISEKQ